MRTGLRYSLAEHVGGTILDALLGTVRIRTENEEAWRTVHARGEPIIFTLWHGRLLPLGYVHRGQGIIGLASQSADGEYIARVLRHWGFGLVRGSSSNAGDRAFRELIRSVRAGRSIAITPDGPRGPRERLKPGAVQLAQITGAPLIPLAAAATRGWWFTSWDRFLVPQPLSRMYVTYGDPIYVARGSDVDTAVKQVEAAVDRVTKRADAAVA